MSSANLFTKYYTTGTEHPSITHLPLSSKVVPTQAILPHRLGLWVFSLPKIGQTASKTYPFHALHHDLPKKKAAIGSTLSPT
jgi:hypothetical protein